MSHRTLRPQTVGAIFRWPVTIGVATLVGLILGLTGDGLPDYAAWLLVGAAPFVVIAALLRHNS